MTTLESLEGRIVKLERQNKKLWRVLLAGVVVLVAGGILGFAPPGQERNLGDVRVGNIRAAKLTAEGIDANWITVGAEKGKRIELNWGYDKREPYILVCDSKGRYSEVDSDGFFLADGVDLRGRGKYRVELTRRGLLTVDTNRNRRIVLEADDDTTELRLYDKNGKTVFQKP